MGNGYVMSTGVFWNTPDEEERKNRRKLFDGFRNDCIIDAEREIFRRHASGVRVDLTLYKIAGYIGYWDIVYKGILIRRYEKIRPVILKYTAKKLNYTAIWRE